MAEENNVTSDFFNELVKLREELSSLETIHNTRSKEFERELTRINQMRQNLLEQLKNQETSHLHQIQELKDQFKLQLEEKDKVCLELKAKIERHSKEHEVRMICSICWHTWSMSGNHRLVALKCGHLFGDSCIRNALERTQFCPHCMACASPGDILYLLGLL